MKIEHPLEDIFGMDNGTMEFGAGADYQMVDVKNQPPVPVEKDLEDAEIDNKIDTVYEAALAAYNQQAAYTEIIEPRYAARNAEVAANYLSIALTAASSRAKVKNDRVRAGQSIPPNKTTNNLIVANREDILRMINIDDEKQEL